MKSTIACLLVLAVAAQAQYYGYGYGGYGGYYGGYYPFAGLRATAAGIPATAAVPAAYPVAYGYPSYTVSATQYHAQDELGQASFGYAHPGHCSTVYNTPAGTRVV